MLPQRIAQNLVRLLDEAERVLATHRAQVLALAHALETHKTLTGEDVIAVLEGREGPLVDGRPYTDPAFLAELETYHAAAVQAHEQHSPVSAPLPAAPTTPAASSSQVVPGQIVPDPHGFAQAPDWVVAGVQDGNGTPAPSAVSGPAPEPEPPA